jgi:hypothetical protein
VGGAHATKLMGDAPDPVPEDLPIVVSANADRISAVARLLLGAVVVLALAGAVALPAHDFLLGTMIQRPRGEYTAAATAGALAAFVAGFLWRVSRSVSWTIDAGGITQDGPGDRRRDLRWVDVRWVRCWSHVFEFYGRDGLTPVRLPRAAIPKGRRASVLPGVEAVLREHFNFPPPLTGGIWRTLARLFALIAVVYAPPCLYLFVFLGPLAQSRPQTIMGWGWVRRLIAWNVDAASALVPLILVAPGLAYLWIAAWFVCRRAIRNSQIVPKRPAGP